MIGDKIKAMLKKDGKKQKWLAEKLGVSEPMISNWIRGRRTPSIKIISKIAEVIGCKVSDIVDENIDKPSSNEFDLYAGLSFDIIRIGDAAFYVNNESEYSYKPLAWFLEKCYGKNWFERGVIYALLLNPLYGLVVCIGNYKKGEAYIVGETIGYA